MNYTCQQCQMRLESVSAAGGRERCPGCGHVNTVAPAAEAPVAEVQGFVLDYAEAQTLPDSKVNYGGFWIRFVASFLDGIILAIPGYLLDFILLAAFGVPTPAGTVPPPWMPSGKVLPPKLSVLSTVLGMVIGLCYYSFMHASRWQATLGKRALGLYVTDVRGGRITIGRAIGRHLATAVSSLTLLIGYIMAAFHPRKRALHDIIAGTYVLRGRAEEHQALTRAAPLNLSAISTEP